MPDLFEGEPCDISIFPPTTDEKKAQFNQFWTTKADFEKNQKAIRKTIEALKSDFKDVEKWAIIGYCWGGKVGVLLCIMGGLN